MFERRFLLNIELTPNCTANCSMCPRDAVTSNGMLKIETAYQIASLCFQSDIWEISFAGRGEPTLHPKIGEIASVFRKTGLPISLVTTTLNLNQHNIEPLVDKIDVFRLSVSSANPDAFSKIHRGLNYKRIWNNLGAIAPAIASKTSIHLTGGPAIYDSLEETVTKLRSFGYQRFFLFPLWNRGGDIHTREDREARFKKMKDLNISVSEMEYFKFGSQVKQMAYVGLQKIRNLKYCAVGDSSLSISFDGKILGCFQDFGHKSIIGSIGSQSIRKIYEERQSILGKMAVCKGCNSYKEYLYL